MLLTMRWTVVIPAKSLPGAKSRLAPMSADVAAHRRLVEAIRADTVAAAAAADPVARVLLVVDAASAAISAVGGVPVEHLVQTRPGLNAAVAEGAVFAAASWPDDGVVALVGDLPALRPTELADALLLAAAVPASFVADASGAGTTMLAATPGHELAPRFGAGSADRHATRAEALDAGPGLRHDVDTAADLRTAAAGLGVGPATTVVLTGLGIPVRSPCLGMIAP